MEKKTETVNAYLIRNSKGEGAESHSYKQSEGLGGVLWGGGGVVRETDTETDRQRPRQRDTDRERHTDTEADRQIARERERESESETATETEEPNRWNQGPFLLLLQCCFTSTETVRTI